MDRFEDRIELHHLEALMEKFREHIPTEELPSNGTHTSGRMVQREPGNVTLSELKQMLASLGISSSDTQIELLFARIDTSADGMVDWNEFANYMILHYSEKDKKIQQEGLRLVGEPSIEHLTMIKQDSIQALTVCENPLRYITLSKEGYLCNFDHNLQLEITHLIREENQDSSAPSSRRFRSWYTGLTFLGNTNMIAVSSSGRDIKFYDVLAQGFVEVFNLYDIHDVPSCLDYWYDERKPHNESVLLMGSDMGSIHLFYFHQPCKRLFEQDGGTDSRVQQIWMPELSVHHEYVRHAILANLHTEMIRKVKFLPVKDLVISSSGSSKTSVVIADIKGTRRSYVFKRKKGVECFDYNSRINVLLTGSMDHKVLAWNPYMANKPMAVLLGHQMAVVGVAINGTTGHAYSFSKDGVLKVWELHSYHCLQTLTIDFPCLRSLKQPEFVPASILLHQGRTLVIGIRDYVAHLRVGRTGDFRQSMPITHSAQLCTAIYNTFFRQIATGADDSSISVWDVESGLKSFSISEAHGSEEITCMTFSNTGRKLYTGARDGSIKVWNFQNGHSIHQCEGVADAEVTGLVSLGKKGLLAVGWSRQITVYDDSDMNVNLIHPSEVSWRGGHLHNDDILATDHAPPGLLATASFDGEILIWSSVTQFLLFRLRKRQSVEETRKLKDVLSSGAPYPGDISPAHKIHISGRPNSRHHPNHKKMEGSSQAPVDKLLFLRWRIQQGLTDCAVLVSSEAGYLHFWSVYDTHHYKGRFYSSSDSDQSVLALATDAKNTMLLSGDTGGTLYIWDIHQYCISSENQVVDTPPPLVACWRAHDGAVVSVEVVELSYGTFVLSASVDQTARLWTLEGHFIGTFGQETKWDLQDPTSYCHPRDPWTVVEQQSDYEFSLSDDNQSSSEENEPDDTMNELLVEGIRNASNPSNSLPAEEIVLDGSKTSVSGVPSPPSSEMNRVTHVPLDGVLSPTSPGLNEATRVPLVGTHEVSDDVRSTVHQKYLLAHHRRSTNHGLGKEMEGRLTTIAKSRRKRRDKYLNLDNPENLTYGHQCKPFQALVTPETTEIDFLPTLPLSTRMLQRGTMINSENDLRNLTFDGDISFTVFHKPPKDQRSTQQLPKI